MLETRKKTMIAMILAGGQGSRLGVLTQKIAKPAVPFGGKYRIIDFTLSNCTNSEIDTVGVLTQYMPLELNAYIGNGQPWDLDRQNGGVSILQPYVKGKRGEWYTGTANAIYQNMHFIEASHPDYVLILSGDHVYKMNYDLMLSHHKAKGADCTISVIQVPYEEASRFGVMSCDENEKIYEFEEKPEHPKSNLASMGVYIFTWDKLRDYLIKDEGNPESENDFGKNIIPAMIKGGENLYAYKFSGYWKDVGTIESLWEANMDLLDPDMSISLYDPPWKIYSKNPVKPPQYIGKEADIKTSFITEGCVIEGQVIKSIISQSVKVGKGAIIYNSIIMPGADIQDGAVVEYAIIGEESIIGKNAKIGDCRDIENPEKTPLITVIGQEIKIGQGVRISAGFMVDKDTDKDTEKVEV
ncbi:glucose-1-phosphate adenylyltransferase [Proteocatella sphenisci]|uniref:glucose-1-phosphate adenylyltransferase n=1 Tax=Proteocatella sphenisci TaxID=181070 RepID=UPI0004BA55CD|nr:glucose-1-phosphate adenylyltransferase [Proteocatella sphenisci]